MSPRWARRAVATATLSLALLGGLPAAGAVAMPVPLVPVNISAAGQDAVTPQVAVGTSGDSVAVWSRYNASHLIVQSASRPAGGAWTSPVDVSLAGRNATEPQVAVDAGGNAVAVWSRYNGSRTVIQGAVRAAGGSWSVPADLSDPERNAEAPQVAVDPAGNAVAVWSLYNGTNDIVQAATLAAGGAWSPALPLSLAGGDAVQPQVAVDAGGNATAVWVRYDGADYIVQSAVRAAGGGWVAAGDLSAVGEPADEPQVAVGPSGEAVAVWSRSDGSDDIVQSAARAPGGAWSAAADLSLPGDDAERPQVTIGRSGEAVAVWSRLAPGLTSVIQAAARAAGGGWSPAVTLSAGGESSEDPQVAVDPAGAALALWSRSDGSPSVIQSSARPAGGGWGPVARLSELGESSNVPQLAFDAEGNGVAVWTREDGVKSRVQAVGLDGAAPQLRGLSIPAAATMGKPVSFSISPFDTWSAIASIGWTFGDEGLASGPAPTHVYDRPGTYLVTVAVADALGARAETTGAVTVFPKARAARNLRLKGRLAQLKVTCPSPAGCEGLAKLIAAVRVRRGGVFVKKRLPIGQAAFEVVGAANLTVPIALTAPARATIREAGKHGLKAQLTGPGIKHRVVALFAPPKRR